VCKARAKADTEVLAYRIMRVTINGKSFEIVDAENPYWTWVEEGRYNHEWQTYDQYLKPNHTFVDLGAWVGAHSLYASTIAKRVIAVEPDPVAYNVLLANLKPIADQSKLTVLNVAVGPEEVELTLGSGMLGASTTRNNLAAGGGIGEATETFIVKSVPLRELLKDVADPLFIKIDIEGMEEALLSDWEWFKERRPTIFIEMHPWWWTNPAETEANFSKFRQWYSKIIEVRHNLYLLEP
jgi:FkbM family methyltransferase